MSVELKPCPFCGSSALLRETPLITYKGCFIYWCECAECKATAPGGAFSNLNMRGTTAKKKAIAAWNRRAE